jgi:hypothetical protein
MRVLIISLFTEWSNHLGTDLEIAQNHLDAGDDVELLSCDASVGRCRVNTNGNKTQCDICGCIRTQAIKLLSKPIRVHRISDFVRDSDIAGERSSVTRLHGVASFRAYEVDGMDIGWGALSTTIDVFRDPFLDTPGCEDVAREQCEAAVKMGRAVTRFLSTQKGFDRAYIFNGRWATSRAAFRACRQAGLDVITHERGCSAYKYTLFENSLPHSREYWHKAINEAWDAASEEQRDVGRQFFEDNRAGKAIIWNSFINGQEKERLPDGWDESRRNIVIFNSSEDEFTGIDASWQWPFFSMQSEEIRRIAEDMARADPQARVYLRMHPNLKTVDNADTRNSRAITADNFVLIPPAEAVSTYDLIEAADMVLTFGSTVGVEATYWGRPSVLAGPAFYEDLDAAYVARSHKQLMDFLTQDLEPKPFENAVKYGFYLRTFGAEFRHWRPTGLFSGDFKGVDIGKIGRDPIERRAWKAADHLGLGKGFAAEVLVAALVLIGNAALAPLYVLPAGRKWLRNHGKLS